MFTLHTSRSFSCHEPRLNFSMTVTYVPRFCLDIGGGSNLYEVLDIDYDGTTAGGFCFQICENGLYF